VDEKVDANGGDVFWVEEPFTIAYYDAGFSH
jgi:hypothetical protein